MTNNQSLIKPFLKWAGGKRWLISKAKDLIPPISETNNYFEPFLGGGSMYFHLQPENSLLSDINNDLINAYSMIRDNWDVLYSILQEYHGIHSADFYYELRATNPETSILKAARFIYLNRTCWNGLYRVNKQGKFNVPIGTKSNVVLEGESFEKLSNLLRSATIEVCDFEEAINRAGERDFVFVDPPYTVKHNLNGFVKYNENIFTWDDQIRLKDAVLRAKNRGANILVTNANHQSILDLYDGLGNINYLDRASVIAGKSKARGIYSEVAIKSW